MLIPVPFKVARISDGWSSGVPCLGTLIRNDFGRFVIRQVYIMSGNRVVRDFPLTSK